MARPNEDLAREGFAAFGRGDLDALRHQYLAAGERSGHGRWRWLHERQLSPTLTRG